MHEYFITKEIVRIASEAAQRSGAQKITEIRLVVGELSTMIDESVQMYFDIIAQDTPAKGAKLVFRHIAAQFKCGSCGNTYDKPAKGFDCPKCGAIGLPTGVGREFYIDSIEVE